MSIDLAFADPASIDPAGFGKVAVLFGGASAEREISIRSGSGVLAALRGRGVDAIAFDPAQRPLEDLKREGVQRVFIALHGRFGEDGTVQGALELLRIPYTGSGVMASAIAMDKVFTKRIWMTHGLPTPKFEVVRRGDVLRELPDRLGLPLILKPPHEGSTLGITKVVGYSEVAGAFELAAKYDDEVLAEEFIDGRELTVAVLGTGADARALPIVEIRAPGGNYDYQNKYFTDDTQYLCPAPLPEALAARIGRLAVESFRALGCEGWARADVMLRAGDDEPFLLEINTSPGMTDHSLVPMAARAAGMDYAELVLRILATARLKVGGVS
ncbi:MAG TPA: D-alanine--D-alanine ligase [Burkholderiaceae bacterium]|nr:D-alanine--D-alanine ligase [Burkholderiaceae bacterium]